MKKGLILTGMIWGVWHLPLYLFRYPSSTLLQELLHQIACCVLIGIFMGYVYLKTKNIWICTAIHFLNNATVIILNFFWSDKEWYKNIEETSITPVFVVFATVSLLLTIALFRIYNNQTSKNIYNDTNSTDNNI